MRLPNMLRRLLCLLLACLLLSGCGTAPAQSEKKETEPVTEVTTEPTEPAPTAPPDGTPGTITEKGSYSGTVSAAAPVATAGSESLTGAQLQLYYGLEIAAWRTQEREQNPDWELGLDVQLCPMEGEAVTWQQFFLQRALNTWHLHTALVQDSADAEMILDPYYVRNLYNNYDTYLLDTMPAVAYLYGYDASYKINDLNKAFVDAIPELLTQLGGSDVLASDLAGTAATGADLRELAVRLNEAYAYFIWARKQAMTEEEAVEGDTVTFRHVLMIPEDGNWDACEVQAEVLRNTFLSNWLVDEPRFAELANVNSKDEGSRLNGGLYQYVSQGQMNEALDEWLFDPVRAAGDTAVIRSELGVHIVYFSGRDAAPERSDLSDSILKRVLERFPMEVSYSDICLGEASKEGAVTASQLLYPDIAHEYITDYPLYLQQDFPGAMYGGYPLSGWGCGITTLAMFASYMTDEWLTPPAMAERYGKYCYRSGTDATLITDSAPELGFFLHDKLFDHRVVDQQMKEGYQTMCLQYKGYFTRGGHYLVLRSLYENGDISIRDSNLFNYGKLRPHKDDHFTWNHVGPNAAMYWTFEPKITRIPACWRCGDETGLEAPEGLLLSDYTCGKCLDAMARMEDFLNYFE